MFVNTANDPRPRVWVRISNLCGGGEVYSNSHFWLFTWRQTIRRPQKHFSSDRNQMTVRHEGASNESSEQEQNKKNKPPTTNVFEQFHPSNPQIHTHCGIDSNRGDEWHYLLQKLLQLNSKLWSIAITSFDQYLLFNRPVVYVAHSIFFPFLSSRSPSSSVATFSYLPSNAMGFSCSFWQWVHFDLSVAIENVRFPRRWHRKKSFCDVENGHRINCMRVTRYAIASNE